MTKVQILQTEIQRLERRLEKLESFERPRTGTDMAADRIRVINERIQQYRDKIRTNLFDASAKRIKRKTTPRWLPSRG